MKILLRVAYAAFLILIGAQLYSCSSQRTYNRAVIEQGNIAYKNNDFTLFKEIFEYYEDEPYVKESFLLENADTRYGVTDTDISFDLTIFLQAERGKNHFTVLITNVQMEDPEYSLGIVVKKNKGERILENNIFRLSANNWYFQYFEFDSETIDQIIITHVGPSRVEPIVFYDSSDYKEVFLTKEEHDIAGIVEKDLPLEDYGIVKRAENPFKGKGWPVLVTLGIYIVFVGIITYALFFNKSKKQTYTKW